MIEIETTYRYVGWSWMEIIGFAIMMLACAVMVATAIYFWVDAKNNQFISVARRLLTAEQKIALQEQVTAAMITTSATRLDRYKKIEEALFALKNNDMKLYQLVLGEAYAKERLFQREIEKEKSRKSQREQRGKSKVRKEKSKS